MDFDDDDDDNGSNLEWSSGMDSLRCVSRVDLNLNGSFADMIFIPGVGGPQSILAHSCAKLKEACAIRLATEVESAIFSVDVRGGGVRGGGTRQMIMLHRTSGR